MSVIIKSGSTTNTANITSSGAIQISGNTGSSLDAGLYASTPPEAGIAVLGQYSSTPPSCAASNTIALQLSPNGSHIVQPYRRSQVNTATGNTASATAATMVPAAGAGIYTDITTLILSVSAETTAAFITVNISDGTLTYKYGIASEAIATISFPPVCLTFSPYLTATTANTAWTIALSAADATVQYTVVYVNQAADF